MQHSKYSYQMPSESSETSSQQSRTNKLKSPAPSNYEYLGRLVTRERPIIQRSKSLLQTRVFAQNRQSMGSRRREVYDDVISASSDDDFDNADGLSRPVGIIRINDQHLREIYRLPTPPPTVKRVYHRLRSPETKVIERVFVRRPPPQIIENIIEVPPEKVRIINREKYLGKSKPITRSKLVHLKARPPHQTEEREQDKQSSIASEQYSQPKTYIPSEQYSQQQPQQATIPPTAPQQQPTGSALVFSPQPNACTVGYMHPTFTQNSMLNPQQPAQVPAQPMTQPSPYTYVPQQTTSQQMFQSTPYPYAPQQTTSQQMFQPTPYNYQPQQTMPNSLYGYAQY